MFRPNKVRVVYDNSLDAYNPQLWAYESIAVLEDNIIAASLVHRDFEPMVAQMGEIVNTRKPASFQALRKGANDDITNQDATSTNIQVALNQNVHVSFLLRDVELSKSFKDLVVEFLQPAMIAQAKFIDQIVLGQAGQFYPNVTGFLGSMTSSNSKDFPIDARTKLNVQKAPDTNRYFIWTPTSEGLAVKNGDLTAADKTNDGGLAMREAYIGRKYGFMNFYSQLLGEVAASNCDRVTGAINSTYGHVASTTALTVDGFSAAIANNSWVSVDGDLHRVVNTSGGSTPNTITIDAPGLRKAVSDNAVVTVIDPAAVNNSGGYAAKHIGKINVDGLTNKPTVGQFVTFGTDPTSAVYCIIATASTGANSAEITVDRPLDVAIADDLNVNFSPPGYYNFAFQRNAVALVVRPLVMIPDGNGCKCYVADYKGLSMRVTTAYNAVKQGLQVTIDMLCGVTVLDKNLGTMVVG